jgi:hypothetical protein
MADGKSYLRTSQGKMGITMRIGGSGDTSTVIELVESFLRSRSLLSKEDCEAMEGTEVLIAHDDDTLSVLKFSKEPRGLPIGCIQLKNVGSDARAATTTLFKNLQEAALSPIDVYISFRRKSDEEYMGTMDLCGRVHRSDGGFGVHSAPDGVMFFALADIKTSLNSKGVLVLGDERDAWIEIGEMTLEDFSIPLITQHDGSKFGRMTFDNRRHWQTFHWAMNRIHSGIKIMTDMGEYSASEESASEESVSEDCDCAIPHSRWAVPEISLVISASTMEALRLKGAVVGTQADLRVSAERERKRARK